MIRFILKQCIPTLLVLSCAVSPHFANSAQERYVATNGSNESSGSESAPWASIQHAVGQAGPGQTVYVRGGVYSEKVRFEGSSSSGSSSGGYLTLRNYPGETPVIDGAGLAPVGREGLISIVDASYVKVVGFELTNFKTSNASMTPVGIYAEGASNHIELRNNKVHDIEQNADGGGAHGIGIFGTNSGSALSDLIIDGNEIWDCILYWSEALVLNGNVRDFTVSNNSVHDCDNIAYDFIGFEGECGGCGTSGANLDQARNGLVVDNIAYNIDTKDNPAYNNERSAAGFYVDGGRDILFDRNIAHDCNLGFELASEHANRATKNIVLRNSIAYNNHILGIATGGYEASVGSTENCHVVNNTLYKNHSSARSKDDWGAEILLQHNNRNNVYKNNIVYAESGRPRVLIDGRGNSGNLIDYNVYFGSSAGSAPGGNSRHSDPRLVNPGNRDFHIGLGSPAIDAGENLAVSVIGTVDFFKKRRLQSSIVDIGAHEYDSGRSSAVQPARSGAAPPAP